MYFGALGQADSWNRKWAQALSGRMVGTMNAGRAHPKREMHKVMFAAAALLAGAIGASQIAAAQDVNSVVILAALAM
jgi:hypothetical protein